ncbi:hypothetical protein SANTM175S_07131 [Streptomyces antimycoticus]
MRSPSGSPWCCAVRSLSIAVMSVWPKTGVCSSTVSGSPWTATSGCLGWRSTLLRYGGKSRGGWSAAGAPSARAVS